MKKVIAGRKRNWSLWPCIYINKSYPIRYVNIRGWTKRVAVMDADGNNPINKWKVRLNKPYIYIYIYIYIYEKRRWDEEWTLEIICCCCWWDKWPEKKRRKRRKCWLSIYPMAYIPRARQPNCHFLFSILFAQNPHSHLFLFFCKVATLFDLGFSGFVSSF